MKIPHPRKPLHPRHPLSAFVAASLAISATCLAQDGSAPPPQGPGSGGRGAPGQGAPGQGGPGQGGPGGMRGDPAQMAERFFALDVDGDGKVTREEATGPFAERVFERTDLNKDGSIDRVEFAEFAKSMPARGGQGGQGGPGGRAGAGGAAPLGFEASMKQANGAFRALRGSAFDAASQKADLEAVQRLQMGLLGSKAALGSVPMSPAAKAKFGEDKAAYEKEFRSQLIESILRSFEVEKAILDGDASRAKAALEKLHDTEETGHELFQDDSRENGGGEGGGERPRARGSRGAAPGA